MKLAAKTILLMFAVVLLVGCDWVVSEEKSQLASNVYQEKETQVESNFVDIKYRDDDVDLNNGSFEVLNTSKSSWVGGAWYDERNDYMIIDLEGTYYHYCGLPTFAWNAFSQADSFGSYYRKELKGEYDCRLGVVPSY